MPAMLQWKQASFPSKPVPGEGAAGLDILATVTVDRRGGRPGSKPRRAADGQQSTPRTQSKSPAAEVVACEVGTTPYPPRDRLSSATGVDRFSEESHGGSPDGRRRENLTIADDNCKEPTSPREAGFFLAHSLMSRSAPLR
jgi:hypothetical protein